MVAADALSALDAAACILAITEFISQLLSNSPVSGNVSGQPSSSSSSDGNNDGHAALETLEKLKIALSNNAIQISPATHQPSSDSLASELRDLVASQRVAAGLLAGVVSALRPLPDQPGSPQGTDARTRPRSRLRGTHDSKNVERLSCAVTRQVRTILR